MKKYSDRIQTLCALLKPTKTFADVGCDHGYCSEYMLKNNLCEYAILSDISAGSLQKAKTLLKSYIESGRAKAVLGDGFFGVPKDTQEVLIAGMGGVEMLGILTDKTYGFLPENFLFQPMKDSDKLRAFLLENGGFIEKDFTFMEGRKYYDVIVGRRRKEGEEKQTYTPAQMIFGRDNILTMPPAFCKHVHQLIENTKLYLKRDLGKESREKLEEKLAFLQGVEKGEIK